MSGKIDVKEIADKIRERKTFGESGEHDMGYLLNDAEAATLIATIRRDVINECRAEIKHNREKYHQGSAFREGLVEADEIIRALLTPDAEEETHE